MTSVNGLHFLDKTATWHERVRDTPPSIDQRRRCIQILQEAASLTAEADSTKSLRNQSCHQCFRQVGVVVALQKLGFHVPLDRNGPHYIAAGGSQMLLHMGYHVKRCLPTDLVNKGKYIVSAHGTCYGIHVGEHVAVSLENEDAAMLGSEEMTMLLADASKIFYYDTMAD